MFNMFLKINQLSHTHFNGAVFVYDEDLRMLLNDKFANYFRLFEKILSHSFKCDLVNRELISLALTIRNLIYILVHFEPNLTEPFIDMICNGIRLLQMNENVSQFFNILGEY